jgi:hypothetical protein
MARIATFYGLKPAIGAGVELMSAYRRRSDGK